MLLGVLTLGIYFLYYAWRVPHEVARQEGVRHPLPAAFLVALVARLGYGLTRVFDSPAWAQWSLLGLGVAFIAAYWWASVALLERGRERTGLGRAMPPALFVSWYLFGELFYVLSEELHLAARVLFAVVVVVPLYFLLNESVNGYWRAQGRRAAAAEQGGEPVASPT